MSEQTTASNEYRVLCEEVLDISSASELRDQLLQALVSERPVVLDAEHVERVDTAALQVLSAFVRDAGAHDQAVRWHAPSQSLQRSAALLGLAGVLGLAEQQAVDG